MHALDAIQALEIQLHSLEVDLRWAGLEKYAAGGEEQRHGGADDHDSDEEGYRWVGVVARGRAGPFYDCGGDDDAEVVDGVADDVQEDG